MSNNNIKDSGSRRDFGTGAVRDCGTGKGRMDLLPFRALIEVAKVFEGGALKYAERNWENGIPLKNFVDSGLRHLSKAMIGWKDEPHVYMALWNIMCLVDTIERIKTGELPEELANGCEWLLDQPRCFEETPDKDRIEVPTSCKDFAITNKTFCEALDKTPPTQFTFDIDAELSPAFEALRDKYLRQIYGLQRVREDHSDGQYGGER